MVHIAYIDCNKLLTLSEVEDDGAYTTEQLLSVITNRQSVENAMYNP